MMSSVLWEKQQKNLKANMMSFFSANADKSAPNKSQRFIAKMQLQRIVDCDVNDTVLSHRGSKGN